MLPRMHSFCKIIHLNLSTRAIKCVLTVCAHNYVETWTPSHSWTGPSPAKYWSFDSMECLFLMEENVPTIFSGLTPGKVS